MDVDFFTLAGAGIVVAACFSNQQGWLSSLGAGQMEACSGHEMDVAPELRRRVPEIEVGEEIVRVLLDPLTVPDAVRPASVAR